MKQHSSPISPPPFMVGMAEVEVDTETGSVDVLDYVAAVDCGTPINPNLARVQTEGGIAQGIGMALWEDVQYTDKGKIRNNSFMQYKIPTRQDIGNIRVAFECSYEKSGPFGAKSIGELVIDTPCPAMAEAIYNATGVRLTELPMTPEKIAMEILKKPRIHPDQGQRWKNERIMPCMCRFVPGIYSFLCSRHCSGPDIESKRDCSLTFILGYLRLLCSV